MRHEWNSIVSSAIVKWKSVCCSCLPINKTCLEVRILRSCQPTCFDVEWFISNVAGRSDWEAWSAPNAGPLVVCSSQVSVLRNDRGSLLTIIGSCATTGEGLFEGLQWLSQNVKKRQPWANIFTPLRCPLYDTPESTSLTTLVHAILVPRIMLPPHFFCLCAFLHNIFPLVYDFFFYVGFDLGSKYSNFELFLFWDVLRHAWQRLNGTKTRLVTPMLHGQKCSAEAKRYCKKGGWKPFQVREKFRTTWDSKMASRLVKFDRCSNWRLSLNKVPESAPSPLRRAKKLMERYSATENDRDSKEVTTTCVHAGYNTILTSNLQRALMLICVWMPFSHPLLEAPNMTNGSITISLANASMSNGHASE